MPSVFKWQKLGHRMVHIHQPHNHERRIWLKDARRKQKETAIKPAILKPKIRGQSDSQTDRASSPANFYLRYLYFILVLETSIFFLINKGE